MVLDPFAVGNLKLICHGRMIQGLSETREPWRLKKKSKLRWYIKAIGTESQADSKKLKVMFVWFKKQDNQISKMEHKQIKSRYKHQLNR